MTNAERIRAISIIESVATLSKAINVKEKDDFTWELDYGSPFPHQMDVELIVPENPKYKDHSFWGVFVGADLSALETMLQENKITPAEYQKAYPATKVESLLYGNGVDETRIWEHGEVSGEVDGRIHNDIAVASAMASCSKVYAEAVFEGIKKAVSDKAPV